MIDYTLDEAIRLHRLWLQDKLKNETSCGVELKDGSFRHIYIDEMQEILRKDKTSEGDKNED